MVKLQWKRLVITGLAGGLMVNICEWMAHRVWLDADWREAFAALGKTPAGWTTFILANFLVGIVAVWGYRWLSGIYGTSFATSLRTAAAVWCIFWLIPIAALAPLDLLPNRLLLLTILVGTVDSGLATLFASWLYDGWKPSASLE
nr:5TMR of 5TMR-LYT [uncultured bacterium]